MPPSSRTIKANLLIFIEYYSLLRIGIGLRLECIRSCYQESFLFTLHIAMYVCLCKAITDSEIREAASNGLHDLDALGESLGVGVGCGNCRESAQAVIDEHLAELLSYAA